MLVALAGCAERCGRLDPATPGQKQTMADAQGRSPLGQGELPSMDPQLALARLDGLILQKAEGVAEHRLDPAIDLAMQLTIRGHLLGRITDLERALELSQRAISEAPADPRGYLRRAQVEAELRRLPEAERQVAEAERLKGDPKTVAGTRARILRFAGRYEEARALLRTRNADAPDVYSLGAEAIALGGLGQRAAAEELFAAAQHLGPDASPFPLAWLYHQQGMMWLAAGEPRRAEALFTAAHERLPQYPRPVAALAPLLFDAGRREEALALVRPIAETAEDPECAGVFADLLARSGREGDAERWRVLAGARYEHLYAAHPELVAERAARFWLHVAKAPDKALAPALRAAALFESQATLTLALEATLAADDAAHACQLAARAAALGEGSTARWTALVEQGRARCAPPR